MNEYLINLILKYRNKGILIDTNLLLLYLIGSYDIEQIRDFKRTAHFNTDDFSNTLEFVESFEIKITTPHVLTEVSNLMGNRSEFFIMLESYIKLSEEKFIFSKDVCQEPYFRKFGLADMVTLETAKNSYLVFTDDRPLFGYLTNLGLDVVSLDQIRTIQ